MHFFLFGLSKTESGAKTAPRVPKLGYYDGRVPKLSSTHATSRRGPSWSVICRAPFHEEKPILRILEMLYVNKYLLSPIFKSAEVYV